MTQAFARDLRIAIKGLLASPAFTISISAVLALAIGVNTAAFSILDALLFRPLPYPDADRLVAVTASDPAGRGNSFWSFPQFRALAEEGSSFERLTCYGPWQFGLGLRDAAVQVDGEIVPRSYFDLLGVTPLLGRLFSTEDEVDGQVIALSYAFWQQYFGGDASVIGSDVTLQDRSFTIVGVLPPSFRGQSGVTSAWVPIRAARLLLYDTVLTDADGGRQRWLRIIGRTQSNTSQWNHALNSALASIRARLPSEPAAATPRAAPEGPLQLIPLRESKTDPAVTGAFLVFFVAASFVLLIGAANTAMFLLSRTMSRHKEFAVRLALGASRAAIARQIFCEGALISLLGGLSGLIVAVIGMRWLAAIKPWNSVGFWSQYARTFEFFSIGLDWRLFAFSCLLMGGAAIVSSMLSVWFVAGSRPNDVLKSSLYRSPELRLLRKPTQSGILLTIEVALSVVLVISAGLLLRTTLRLSAVHLGIDPGGVVTLSLGTQQRQGTQFYRELLDRVAGVAGVSDAAIATALPLSGPTSQSIEVQGLDPQLLTRTRATLNSVSPGFLKTHSIQLVEGRDFTERDQINSTRVALVSRGMASSAWPGESPLGKRIRTAFRLQYGDPAGWFEVVGVVDDVEYGAVEDPPEPAVYLSSWQPLGSPTAVAHGPNTISVRSSLTPAVLIPSLRRVVHSLSGNVPIREVLTMRERSDRLTARFRFGAMLIGILAGLCLLITTIGLYSMVSWSVAAQVRDIAVRMAIGASPNQAVFFALRGAFGVISIGLIIGVATATAFTPLLSRMLFEVKPIDGLTFSLVIILFLMVSVAAALLPVRKVITSDILRTLRFE